MGDNENGRDGFVCLLALMVVLVVVSPVVVVVVMLGARGPLLFTGCSGGRRQSPSLVDEVALDEEVMVGDLQREDTSM